MNNETLEVIKYSLCGGPVPAVADWDVLVRDLEDQAVLPILGTENRLSGLELQAEPVGQLKKKIIKSVNYAAVLLRAQSEMTEFFASHGATAIVLKGAAAGVNYPDPMYRTYGDIDFMLRGISVDEAVKLMLREGFISEADVSPAYDERHVNFKRNGITFELHYYFSEKKDDFEKKLDEMIDDAEPVCDYIFGEKFYRLDDVTNGLVLLQHIHQHLLTGIGIRQFIDWGMYVDKVLSDELWKQSFESAADKIGLRNLAVYATALNEIYLGGSKREFASTADASAVAMLINEISAAGNFGRKRSAGQIHSSAFLNEGSIIKRLQAGGMVHWKAARRHRGLRPFAWVYQGFRLLGIYIAHPETRKQIKEGAYIQKNQDRIFEKLGVGKYRKNRI